MNKKSFDFTQKMFSRKYKTFGEQELKQVKEKFTLIVADITRIKVEIPETFLVRLGPETTKVEIEDLGRGWIRLLHEVEDRCGSLVRRTSELQKTKKDRWIERIQVEISFETPH